MSFETLRWSISSFKWNTLQCHSCSAWGHFFKTSGYDCEPEALELTEAHWRVLIASKHLELNVFVTVFIDSAFFGVLGSGTLKTIPSSNCIAVSGEDVLRDATFLTVYFEFGGNHVNQLHVNQGHLGQIHGHINGRKGIACGFQRIGTLHDIGHCSIHCGHFHDLVFSHAELRCNKFGCSLYCGHFHDLFDSDAELFCTKFGNLLKEIILILQLAWSDVERFLNKIGSHSEDHLLDHIKVRIDEILQLHLIIFNVDHIVNLWRDELHDHILVFLDEIDDHVLVFIDIIESHVFDFLSSQVIAF